PNAPALGSDANVALPRISRQASPAPRRGSWWQASACSLAASQGLEMTGIILSQTLRMRAGLEPRPLLRKGVLAFAAHHWTAFVIRIHLSNSTCFFVPAAHFCARVLLSLLRAPE